MLTFLLFRVGWDSVTPGVFFCGGLAYLFLTKFVVTEVSFLYCNHKLIKAQRLEYKLSFTIGNKKAFDHLIW